MTINYADRLRWFADWLEDHPQILECEQLKYDYPSLYIYADNAEQFSELVRTIGSYEKSGYNGTLAATKRQLDRHNDQVWRLEINVTGVCKKVPKLDDNGQQIARKKRTWVETDEVELEFDYECPEVWSNLTSTDS